MSRKVDVDGLKNLEFGQLEQVYTDIASVLCPVPPTLIEIEFLGKSHPLPDGANVLVDGSSVAIPKIKLVEAFMHARQAFFETLKPCPPDRHEELLRVTAVILLMDPEHLTASNARKRVLQRCSEGDQTRYKAALRRELLFVDSYLTSRLHRHTKSPTLWSHRRWLIERFQTASLSYDMMKHLDVVLTAAERHPRNYYAWLHLRWLVQHSSLQDKEEDAILDTAQAWSLQHPSDTSGFSFLYFYANHLDSSREGRAARSATFRNILTRAAAFDWTHESVWVFLRTYVASSTSELDEAHYRQLTAKLNDTN